MALHLPLHGQIANTKKAIAKMRSSRVILGLTGDANIDAALRTAVDSFWTVTPISEELPREEALKKAKKNDRLVVLTTGDLRVQGYTVRSRWPAAR